MSTAFTPWLWSPQIEEEPRYHWEEDHKQRPLSLDLSKLELRNVAVKPASHYSALEKVESSKFLLWDNSALARLSAFILHHLLQQFSTAKVYYKLWDNTCQFFNRKPTCRPLEPLVSCDFVLSKHLRIFTQLTMRHHISQSQNNAFNSL